MNIIITGGAGFIGSHLPKIFMLAFHRTHDIKMNVFVE